MAFSPVLRTAEWALKIHLRSSRAERNQRHNYRGAAGTNTHSYSANPDHHSTRLLARPRTRSLSCRLILDNRFREAVLSGYVRTELPKKRLYPTELPCAAIRRRARLGCPSQGIPWSVEELFLIVLVSNPFLLDIPFRKAEQAFVETPRWGMRLESVHRVAGLLPQLDVLRKWLSVSP